MHAPGKPHVLEIGQFLSERLEPAAFHLPVDMDHHRAIPLGPMPRHLRRAVQGGVAQHDDAQRAHAQFPLDMRPRISNWRQLM